MVYISFVVTGSSMRMLDLGDQTVYSYSAMSTVPWEALALGEFFVEKTEALDRLLPTGSWLVPEELELDGDVLRWTIRSRGRTARWATSSPSLFTDFLQEIAEGAPDEAITDFARRWGTLTYPSGRAVRPGPEPRLSFWKGAEPIALWRSTWRQFAALLALAAKVDRNESTSLEDWDPLATAEFVAVESRAVRVQRPDGGEYSAAVGVGRDHTLLAEVVSSWLAKAPSPVRLTWDQRNLRRVEFAPESLLSALVLQLAFTVAKAEGLATCSACGAAFTPKRRPAPGRRCYCPTCGLQAARRDAVRDYRRRLKED